MDGVLEAVERAKRMHEGLVTVAVTSQGPEATEWISDPGYPMDKIPLEQYLHRQGWHRQPALDGKTLENFDQTTPEIKARLRVIRQYVGGELGDTLLMFGAPGRGKTHLARGIMAEFARQGRRGIYWPLMQLIGKLKGLMNGGVETPDSYVDWLCRFQGLLIIDELGRSKGGDWDRDNVIYPLTDRRQNLPTVWISNYDTTQLESIYDGAIVSRLMAGRVISFPERYMADWRTKR
jgi:DNA replication protein DnaC